MTQIAGRPHIARHTRRAKLAVLPIFLAMLLLAAQSSSGVAQSGPQPQQGAVVQSNDATDPPARVGRLSYISGTVSFHTLDEDQWEPAVMNYPVTEGTSFWTERGARATLQVGHGVLQRVMLFNSHYAHGPLTFLS